MKTLWTFLSLLAFGCDSMRLCNRPGACEVPMDVEGGSAEGLPNASPGEPGTDAGGWTAPALDTTSSPSVMTRSSSPFDSEQECLPRGSCAVASDAGVGPCSSDHCQDRCDPQTHRGCTGENPLCLDDGSDLRCVECLSSLDCARLGAGGTCLSERCQPCHPTTHQGCSDERPYCLSSPAAETFGAQTVGDFSLACSECLDGLDCGGERPGCFEGNCVECTENAHCIAGDATRCDMDTRTCTACQEIGDCAHIPGKPACDTEARRCVECTRDEQVACMKDSRETTCVTLPGDPARYTCSDKWRQASEQCEECVSDEQCASGFGCVAEEHSGPPAWDETPTGRHYCMRRTAALDAERRSCYQFRPFWRTTVAISEGRIDDEEFCDLGAWTTCKAYLDAVAAPRGTPCRTDDDCGLQDLEDGKCIEDGYGDPLLCSIQCNSDDDCPTGGWCPRLMDGVFEANICSYEAKSEDD
jgi:hypothetical protein